MIEKEKKESVMNVEIISVGSEILLGNILNTNTRFLSRELAVLGYNVYYHTTVGDNPDRLEEALKTARNRADIIILCGGLGPTDDDITKEIVARYLNKKPVRDEKSLEHIENYFQQMGKKMPQRNAKQAYFPENARILPNYFGTAPGCLIEEKGTVYILLPGPLRELQPMFENQVEPYLKSKQKGIIKSTILRITGLGESTVADLLRTEIEEQTNPTLALYSKEFDVIARITARADDRKTAGRLIDELKEKVKKQLGNAVYAEGDTMLEEVVADLLMTHKLSIATAESCTGGLIAGRLINYPGISNVFREGFITYSYEAKTKRLGVQKTTLKKYGAVSREVVQEMVEGLLRQSGADVGLAVTGIAGPQGGTPEKPVGLVWTAVSVRGETLCEKYIFNGDRQTVRRKTTMTVLNTLRKKLLTFS